MRCPTWGEIRRFLLIDGWEPLRTEGSGHKRSGHDHFRKALPGGVVLRTHVSLSADKSPGPDRFALILRDQLDVGAESFWAALQTGQPVQRPTPPAPAAPAAAPAWVWRPLLQAGYTHAEIGRMSPDEAIRLVQDLWSRESGE